MQHFVGVIIIFIKLTKTTRLLPDFTKAWKTMACRWGCRRAARWTPWLVAALGDEADDVYFVKLEPRRRGVRQDDASVNFIKPAPWRTKAWRLGRMPLPCRGRWRHGVRQDDANVNIINPVSQGS